MCREDPLLKVNWASSAPAALFVNPENATEMLL
jgi:hypothetical protein